PTARQVELLLWEAVPPPGHAGAWSPPGRPEVVPMTRAAAGTWSVTGPPGWADRCYQLQLEHVLPRTGHRRSVRSTDPWSVGLAIGSTHSVVVDLQDPRWAPEVWARTPAPPRLRAVDQVVYEVHVRDLTRDDPEVPAALRGSYLGLGRGGAAYRHLRALAGAGLTTVHLLPVFDLTSVEEDPALREEPDPARLAELTARDPAGTGQQALVTATAARDAFNWGYDPWHFLAPEGSYTSTAGAAHGGRRVAECRALVGE